MMTPERYFDFITCVLMADGDVAEEERTLFESMLKSTGVSTKLRTKYRRVLRGEHGLSEADTIAGLASAAADELTWLVRDAFLMANADGNVSHHEVAVINRLLLEAGVPKSRLPKIKKWGLAAVDHLVSGVELMQPRPRRG